LQGRFKSVSLDKNRWHVALRVALNFTVETKMDSLQGHFLIATPQMPDPRFRGMVLYMCVYTHEGAMGIIINQPTTEITMADIFRQAEIPVPSGKLPPVRMGGPVELDSAFFLYSSDYISRHYLVVSDTVHLSRDPGILHDIALGKGPKDYIFTVGYSGWAPGQLENELKVHGWLTAPADMEILFRTPDEHKWKAAIKKLGIDISLFGDQVGFA